MYENKLKIEELLFNDQPITINRKLAKCLGLKEAVVFQQIHYWLEINKKTNNNFKDGKYWTYNSIKKWHENEFDFLSIRTVERTIQKLEKDGLLISKVFNKMKGDKTKWYTINYEKLLEVCEKSLNEKEILSLKRSELGKRGALAKQEKKLQDNTIQPNWQNGGASNQIGKTIQPNWQNDSTKLAEPIPEITTKTSTKTSTCSSNNLNELEKYFEDNICELKKTTKVKFKNWCLKLDSRFIKEVISYGADTNAKSFKWFDDVIKINLDKNIDTVDKFKLSIEKFKTNKSKEIHKKKDYNKSDKDSFNNFEQRKYDWDELEKDLLGWS